MIFRQVLNDDLACASYLVGDAGEAIVVDPNWEIEPYLELERAHRLTIKHVVDTHVHADHVSGRSRLAAATGATAYLPPHTGASAPHSLLRDGDVLQVGAVTVEALATPGHRAEHLSLLVTDGERSEAPCLLCCGDSLLVGDVARPDLAASGGDEVGNAARALFGAMRRLSGLPDHVEVWPGHIGGSLCGAAGVTGRISSTIGFERHTNPGFELDDEESFVAGLVERLPERPPTVDLVVSINRGGEPRAPRPPASLTARQARALLDDGAVILDGRPSEAFDHASIPGSFSVPLGELGVGSRAAWVVGPEEAIVLVAVDSEQARQLAGRLAAVGLQKLAGVLPGGVAAWSEAGFPLVSRPRIDAARLADLLRNEGVTLVDVRDQDEYELAHVPGSLNLPWRRLRRRAGEVEVAAGPIVVACASGRRTALAASVLARERGEGMGLYRLAEAGIPDLAAHGVELTTALSASRPRRPRLHPAGRATGEVSGSVLRSIGS